MAKAKSGWWTAKGRAEHRAKLKTEHPERAENKAKRSYWTPARIAKYQKAWEDKLRQEAWDLKYKKGKPRGRGANDIKWRKSVFERDYYLCTECGADDLLQAHHIEPYSTAQHLRYEISNGQTLCLVCHAAKHPNYKTFILKNRYVYHKQTKI